MICKIIQGQRKGKGAVGCAIMLTLMAYYGYAPEDCCGNASLFIEGYKKFTSEQIVNLMHHMIERKVKGKALWVTEADRVFPPRYWHNKDQTHALIGVQQDQKLGNCLIYDTHWRGVDVLLDDAATFELIPVYRKEIDAIDVEIIGLRDLIPHFKRRINNVSKRIFPYYDTLEPVE